MSYNDNRSCLRSMEMNPRSQAADVSITSRLFNLRLSYTIGTGKRKIM